MSNPLKKFSTQADPEIIQELKLIAKKEGKQFQALVDEAFRDLIEKKKNAKPRKHVMDTFHHSFDKFDILYDKLAQ